MVTMMSSLAENFKPNEDIGVNAQLEGLNDCKLPPLHLQAALLEW